MEKKKNGGARSGAGRPAGSTNLISLNLRTKIEEAGVVEFLIDVYMGKPVKSNKKGEPDQIPTIGMRVDVAQFLTKKIVPDLKAVEHSVNEGSNYETLVERLANKEKEKKEKMKNVN